MAFVNEQHVFISVYDINCIREKGYSTKEEDWTLVYYPPSSDSSDPVYEQFPIESRTKEMRVSYP